MARLTIDKKDSAPCWRAISNCRQRTEQGELEFDVSAGFLDFFAQGNRILFRLRDQRQLPSVALIAYEHALQFNFRRDGDRINLVLFSEKLAAVRPKSADDAGL